MNTEHNPGRYSEMSKPRTSSEIDKSIEAFYAALTGLRVFHKLADVHVIVRVIVDVDGNDAPAFSTMHLGAVQEAEGMCAYAFAKSSETRSKWVNGSKVAGRNSVSGAAA